METIREFSEILEEVMNDLRFLKGLDDEKVCKFRNLLTKIIEEWKDEEYVPKFLCNLFIDFYPCAEACLVCTTKALEVRLCILQMKWQI